MKKVLLFSLALIATAAISSCNKDRVCECTITSTGLINLTFTEDTTFTNVSKSDAEAKCSALNTLFEEPLTGTKVESICDLQ